MALAKITAMRSKDPNTKVGAAIINQRKRVIGLGYNGMPNGNDKDFPWKRKGKIKDTKYPYVVHSEMNAILNATQNVRDAKIYISLFPCSNCAKFLVQSGIKEVIYEQDIYQDIEDNKIARNILEKSQIKIRQFNKINIIVKK